MPPWLEDLLDEARHLAMDDDDDRARMGVLVLEVVEHQRAELADALAHLVGFIDKYGGYMSAKNQAALRGAKALLRGP
jgi:hypothetical protein